MKILVVVGSGAFVVLFTATLVSLVMARSIIPKKEQAKLNRRIAAEVAQWAGVAGLFAAALFYSYSLKTAILSLIVSSVSAVALGFAWFEFVKSGFRRSHSGEGTTFDT